MKPFIILISLFLMLISLGFKTSGYAINPKPDKTLVYKTIGETSLSMNVFLPKSWKSGDNRPVLVLFHGGAWKGGSPSDFYFQCEYLAHRGQVAISVEYRLDGKYGKLTPKECVEDGKSALRWVRVHASELGVDPEKILVGGGSAGGHVAAAATMCDGFNTSGEDSTILIDPKALVLFNPVLNTSPEGSGYELVKDYWQKISPSEHIRSGLPPMLLMYGDEDAIYTKGTVNKFREQTIKAGNFCELKLYPGYKHAFFNITIHQEAYRKTLEDVDKFLVSLGFLKGLPDLDFLLMQCKKFDS